MKRSLLDRIFRLGEIYSRINEESQKTGEGWDAVMYRHNLDGATFGHALVDLFVHVQDYCSAAVLREKYGHWGEHPDFWRKSWRYEVDNNDTILGYWEWVAARVESQDSGARAEPDDKGPAVPDNEPRP